jgi:hypothetical protein
MGFDQYQSKPPKESAAPALLRELRAIEVVVNLLLEAKEAELVEINRSELKEEKNQPDAPRKDEKGGNPRKKLVQKAEFQIKFKTNQERFQKVFNEIISNKQQFFIVRNLFVKNEKIDPPSKVAALPPQGGPTATPPTPTSPGNPVTPPPPPAREARTTNLESVFGTEKVEVTLDIDILEIAEPAAPAVEKTSGNKQPK